MDKERLNSIPIPAACASLRTLRRTGRFSTKVSDEVSGKGPEQSFWDRLLVVLLAVFGFAIEVTAENRSNVSAGAGSTESRVEWWAFRKLTDPDPPVVSRSDWPRNSIDRFILARLEREGLAPSPRADGRTLLRRITFDLIGLPPTPEEVDEFVQDPSPHAYEKVVDRLLASPHFGERWARHWLDVIRFAESDGFERNSLRPQVWPYRDWVIQAFNDDLPYDEFVRLQIAGDVLRPDDPAGAIAAAYLVLGPYDLLGSTAGTEAMRAATRQDHLEDMVGNIGQAFLGLTVQCARCHDHKYDPIPQREYYQVAALIGGVWPGGCEIMSGKGAVLAKAEELRRAVAETRPHLERLEGVLRKEVEEEIRLEIVRAAEETERRVSKAVEDAAERLVELKKKLESASDSEKAKKDLERSKENLAAKIKEWEAAKVGVTKARESKPQAPYGRILDRLPEERRSEYKRWVLEISRLEMRLGLIEPGSVATVAPKQPGVFHVLERGDIRNLREVVRPAGISAVPGSGGEFGLASDAPEGERRQKLAEWITDPGNPLLARVIVNRVWQYHFGVGLVDTPNDFGANGGRPSHPELLDWLASELIRERWSLKTLHRLIVTSATYQQDSRARSEARHADSGNRLLWKRNSQRLEAETMRDAMLAICGALNPEMGGPSYRDVTPEKSGDNTGYRFVGGFDGVVNRRSIYRTWIRRGNHPLLEALDCADPSISIPRRTVTTTPLQALSLLNNEFTSRAAETFAGRLQRETGNDVVRQIERAYRLTYLRDPSAGERESARKFVAEHGLAEFCVVLFNSNEFAYVD